MTKIAKIEVSDFRGFESVRTFEFDDADIVIFLGMNGFGKTSIFDAVEWCLTGHISRYESYLVSGRKQDFTKEKKVLRNKYATDPHTLVKIDLTNGTKFGRRVTVGDSGSDYGTGSIIDGFEFGLNAISNQSIDADVMHHYFSATHILSQETIHHFITSKKPEDRYRALSVNFGTSLYEPFEENAQKLLSVLKEREEALVRKRNESSTRIEDFRGQLQTKAEQIEDQIIEANKVVSELKMHSPNILLSEYVLHKSESKISGSSKEDIQKVISSIKGTIDELHVKYLVLVSLAKDHNDWVSQNKELSELDKQVIGNKQEILKIKENEATRVSLENDEQQTNAILQRELSDQNIAEFVNNKMPFFIERKAESDLLTIKIEQQNSAAGGYQERLSSLMETLLSSELELKTANERSQEIEVLANELQAFSLKEIQRSELDLNVKAAAAAAAAAREEISKIKDIEVLINTNLVDLDTNKIEQICKLDPTLDRQLLLTIMGKMAQIKDIAYQVKSMGEKRVTLDFDYSLLTKNLSKSQAMLNNALELIPAETTESPCPVCDVTHDTQQLFSIIKSKLKTAESIALQKLTADISKIDTELKESDMRKQSLSNDMDTIRSNILQTLNSKILSLNNTAEKSDAIYERFKADIQQLDAERYRLFAKASDLLRTEVKKVSDVNLLIHSELRSSEERKSSFKSRLEEYGKQKIEIEKLIELQLTSNRIAQERLAALQSTDYISINRFLIEKGFTIGEQTINQVAEYLEKQREVCVRLSHKSAKIAEEKAKNHAQMIELTHNRTETQIEKEIIVATKRITEINRLLFDYKERCMRVGIDLGIISLTVINDEVSKHSSALIHATKSHEMLSGLLEKARDFLTFSREDSIRKKIEKVEEEKIDLGVRIEQIKNTRQRADELKKKFPKVIEKYIKENLDVKLFNQIYHSLNPHRRFKEIDFKVEVSHNKVGINFNAKHSELTARPEFLFSSAQLNTFGVSMFLSMALRQNWLNLDTVLLDDPIQNLDDINVLSLIDLLRGLLDLKSGKQIILSTHDERFYNLVKRKFSDYKIKAFKFESYGRVTPDNMSTSNLA